MTTAVKVDATSPPSRCVTVLGYTLAMPPAHASEHTVVVVCLGPGPQIQAITGSPAPPSVALPPVLPEGASPVARVDLPAASPVVFPNMITLLDAEGHPIGASS